MRRRDQRQVDGLRGPAQVAGVNAIRRVALQRRRRVAPGDDECAVLALEQSLIVVEQRRATGHLYVQPPGAGDQEVEQFVPPTDLLDHQPTARRAAQPVQVYDRRHVVPVDEAGRLVVETAAFRNGNKTAAASTAPTGSAMPDKADHKSALPRLPVAA